LDCAIKKKNLTGDKNNVIRRLCTMDWGIHTCIHVHSSNSPYQTGRSLLPPSPTTMHAGKTS